ncbi:MAG: peptidylprolyl isomerase [Candidatus Pelagibacter sp.]
MKKKIFFYLFIFIYLVFNQTLGLENKIIYKVNNEIVTSFDIKLEEKYLIIFNPNLKELDKTQLNKLAIDSILKELIKKIELERYFIIEKSLDDKNLNNIIKDLYIKIGIKNEKDFANFLDNQNLNLKSIKNKIAIEMLWNNLIFKKYNKQVVINEVLLKKQINKEIKKINKTKKFLLSEILIKNTKDLDIKQEYEEIIQNSKKIGFNNTANIYSKSDSAKYGGKIGWIQETSLSPKIVKNIIDLNKGEISKPIKISDNFIILKIDDIKINKKKINKDKILQNRIIFEKNRQLERFSIAYLNRVKQNIKINEL